MEVLTIGQLAHEAGVNVETIRYYERRGNRPGHRLATASIPTSTFVASNSSPAPSAWDSRSPR
jgi:hypothetical protein